MNVHFSSQRQNWKTPTAFYKALDAEFRFKDDPCPLIRTDRDGLTSQWDSPAFVNPPYNEIDKWVEKAWIENKKGCEVVMLIPSRTDTKWWHDFVMLADEIRFVKGRLKFGNAKHSAPFPSCIVIFKGIWRTK